ncbi:S41 family peptidase [Dokdonia ponticola]|uniref:S41 family peptidase n=1 Tax=Dokdonia ponticola TaxID=2041041 RepID=A0ABV9HV40_9FLAO
MRLPLFYLAVCVASIISAQNTQIFNLNFEKVVNQVPSQWNNFGGDEYKVGIDSTVVQEGRYSASLESIKEGKGFKAWGLSIPVTFGGKKVKLTGYLKTENVSDGYGGLWMRIDPQVGFDNMNNRGVKGTTDWKKYEIELDLKPNEATDIVVGGILVGKGKIWIDNLKVTIDGKPLDKAPEKELSGAQKDTEFDAGSRFTMSTPTPQEAKNLTVLGKVWGFLKYHHLAIATGEINWDYELFRILEEIAFAKADSERDQRILTWIDTYGPVAACKKCKETTSEAYLKPDNAWMTSSGLSKELQERLVYIYNNRFQGKHYYINKARNIGNPIFSNENPYTEMKYPDTGFRLLSLYRYWNMIHYYFPYKDVMDKDWNAVLEEYIPRFITAKNELEYEVAALQIIGDIKDTHANLWGGDDQWEATKGSKYPPVHLQFIENNLVIVDFYNPEMKASLDLELGDVITSINGVSTSKIIEDRIPYYPASNQAARMRDISSEILKGNGASLDLTVSRDGEDINVKMPLYERKELDIYSWYRVPGDDVKSYKMLPNNIGYVTLANVTREDPKAIAKEFLNCKGMIIDIRNYPSAFMPFALGQFIAPRGTEFVKFTTPNLKNPGEFLMGSPLMIGAGNIAKEKFKGKVVVLVNELSQSQAEYTAMAFRAAPNTTIIGSTTAGADGNVSAILLPGGLRTMISGIGVFYPDGSPTQRVGIVPDIEVKPTIQGIKEGRDELLDKAIEIIDN